jgi:hypothetical protein
VTADRCGTRKHAADSEGAAGQGAGPPKKLGGVVHCEARDAVRPGAGAAPLDGYDPCALLVVQELDEGPGLRRRRRGGEREGGC